jgi:RNA polymerase sigma-70 factor, ECF subfamily
MVEMAMASQPGDSGAVTDDVLVRQALDGNERAFAALYHRHARYVAGIVYRIMGNDADLDDILQDAFVDASRALATLEDQAGFRSWLSRIVVRRVHKQLGRRRRFRWLTSAVALVAPRVSDPSAQEPVTALYRALEEMSPRLRIPWTLHVIEGQTLPDVAVACDASLATIKRRITEASALIDRRLHERG